MYHIKITHEGDLVASSYQDLLCDSVEIANSLSYINCEINIYECIRTSCDFENITKVLSWKDDGYRS